MIEGRRQKAEGRKKEIRKRSFSVFCLLLSAFCLLPSAFYSALATSETASVQFIDATKEAGIDFKHTNGASGRRYLPETLGSGAAFFDYDDDGDLDLYIVNSADLPGFHSDTPPTNILYRNNGDGTFTEVTKEAGVGDTGFGMGCAVADYDNDGDKDLYVTDFGPNLLYKNNGDGTFTDVTKIAKVGDERWGSSAAFFDYDKDGDLDLFVVNYLDYTLETDKPCKERDIRTYCHPRHFDGASDVLYRNNGDGTFADVTKKAGVYDGNGKGLGVVVGDYNNDSKPDILVANDSTRNFLYKNNGNGTFTDVGLLAGVGYSEDGVARAGMGVDFGDYDRDGFLDIFVTNLSHETNGLFHNNGDNTFSDLAYAAHLGEESFLFVGFGTEFFDYDNDGWLDIFVANGHVMDNVSQVTDTLTYAQRNQFFKNNGDGEFTEVSFQSGEYFKRQEVSCGTAFGDYDNDGDVDVFVTNSNQPATFLRNDGGNKNNWLMFKIIGTKSNRDGIGTRIKITSATRSQFDEVRSGSSYLSASDQRLIFGLGKDEQVDIIEITWPSGLKEKYERLNANQLLIVIEGIGLTMEDSLSP